MKYGVASNKASMEAMASTAAVVSKKLASLFPPCKSQVFANVGLKTFRRPLLLSDIFGFSQLLTFDKMTTTVSSRNLRPQEALYGQSHNGLRSMTMSVRSASFQRKLDVVKCPICPTEGMFDERFWEMNSGIRAASRPG